jgi:hypothetical protein
MSVRQFVCVALADGGGGSTPTRLRPNITNQWTRYVANFHIL